MALGNTHSFSSYTTITQEFTAGSTAVITGGVGRGGLAGVVTNGTTFFAEDLYKDGQLLYLTTVINGMALRVVTLPASGRRTIFTYLESGGTAHVTVTVDDTGIIEAYRGTQAGTLLASAADPIVAGLYYDLEVKVTIADSGGRVAVKLWTDAVTSSLIIDFTGDTRNAGTGLISNLSYGVNASSPIANWSDAWWCTSLGASFNDFLGNKHIAASYPTAPGAFDGWEPVPAKPNWANIDEHPPDGDTSYNYAPADMTTNATGQSGSSYAFPNPPPGPQQILVTPFSSPTTNIHQGDLLLLYVVYNYGDTVAVPIGTGFALLGEMISGTGVDQTITRLYWKIATNAEPSTYIFGWTESGQTTPGGFVIRPGFCLVKVTNVDIANPIDDYANAANTDTGPSVTLTGSLGGRFFVFSSFAPTTPATAGIDDTMLPAGFGFVSGFIAESGDPSASGGNPIISAALSKAVTTPQASGPIVLVWIPSVGNPPVPPFAGIHGVHSVAVRSKVGLTEEHDAFVIGSTSAPTVNAVVVKVLAKSVPVTDDPVTDRTVGVVSRFSASEVNSSGVVPGAAYHYIPFPLEQAANATSWTQAKRNASQFGYEIAAPLPPTYDLDVTAINPGAVAITVSPPDNSAASNGTTTFSRNYNPDVPVTLTAPGTAGGNPFSKWKKDGVDNAVTAAVIVPMDADHTMQAVYTGGACTTGSVILGLNGTTLTPQGDGSEITTWVESGIHGYTLTDIEYATSFGPRYDTTPADNIRYSEYNGGVGSVNRGLRLPAPVNVDLNLPGSWTLTCALITESIPTGYALFGNLFSIYETGGWDLSLVNAGTNFQVQLENYRSGTGETGAIISTSVFAKNAVHKLLITVMSDGTNVRMLINGVEEAACVWINDDSSNNWVPSDFTSAATGAVGMDSSFLANLAYGQIPFLQINDTNLSDADRQAIDAGPVATYTIPYTVSTCSIGCV